MQEEALWTVLEMMEKECEDRVVDLDNELARVESERECATSLQQETAAKATVEEANRKEIKEACRLAWKNWSRSVRTREKKSKAGNSKK